MLVPWKRPWQHSFVYLLISQLGKQTQNFLFLFFSGVWTVHEIPFGWAWFLRFLSIVLGQTRNLKNIWRFSHTSKTLFQDCLCWMNISHQSQTRWFSYLIIFQSTPFHGVKHRADDQIWQLSIFHRSYQEYQFLPLRKGFYFFYL